MSERTIPIQTLLFLYIGGGLLLAALALPLLAKKIKPNPFYGFRVKKTLENPDLWYATNQYFAMRQLVLGLVFVVAAFGLTFWPGLSVDTYALACLAVFVVAFSMAVAQSMQYLKSL